LKGRRACPGLLFGTGSLTKGTSGMAPVCLGTSTLQAAQDYLQHGCGHDERDRSSRAARHSCAPRPDTQISPSTAHPITRCPACKIIARASFESSTHVAQVTLGNKCRHLLVVPRTTGEVGAAPDYWSGQQRHAARDSIQERHVVTSALNDLTG